MTTTATPGVYVGTYGKYNAGNLAGAWLDLADYSDRDEFLAACAELHKDEHDPEFMFQDWEGIPAEMISESYIEDGAFEFAALDDDDREMVSIYLKHVNQAGTLDEAREAFIGKYTSKADAAEEFANDCGDLQQVPKFYRYHIDWDGVARELELSGDWVFVEVSFREVWLFRGNV